MRLVHSFSPFEEICVLFDDDGTPVEVSVWRDCDLQTGALYIARATGFVGAGWFLDVGNGRSAYLNNPPFYLKPDGSLCRDKLTEGDRLIVRIVRPETTEKEAEATHKVTLSGRWSVLMPTQNVPVFSRRMKQQAADRLKLLAPNEGVLFRTAAQDAELDDIAAEIEDLKRKWRSLLSGNDDRPGVFFKPDRDVFQFADQYRDVLSEVVTDDPEAAARLKKENIPVSFEVRGVWRKERLDEVLDAAAAVRSPLPSGGSLITQQTAACVCFDVNAGAGRVFEANEEACPEVLRQIRLKGLGGQMIIDFAGRKEEKTLRRLIRGLKNENVFISGVSTLGLVEITVEKTRRSLFDVFSPEQKAVRFAADVVRLLWFASVSPEVTVFAPSAVLNLIRPYVGRLEKRLNAVVKTEVSENLRLEGIKDESPQCV